MTRVDPRPPHPGHFENNTIWLSFDDSDSVTGALAGVRALPGHYSVWMTDIPTVWAPEQETAIWEIALRSQQIVVPSRCALARVLASGVVHPASVVVVPLASRVTGIGCGGPVAAGSGPLIVTPTSLQPAERVDHVLDAIAGLRRRGVQTRYHVVVDPGLHRHSKTHVTTSAHDSLQRWEAWQERATRLGLEDQVTWSLEGDPLGTMASSQVVVLPWETDDLVASQGLVDAVSLGVPVLASSFPHAVEMAPTGAVSLWRSGSRQSLERALHRVLTRPMLRTAMRHAARHVARSHTRQAVEARLAYLSLTPPASVG